MERPTHRPEQRLSPSEILRKAEQHFVVDKAPRGMRPGLSGKPVCSYAGTGCFVGFLLTEEDAQMMPHISLPDRREELEDEPEAESILSHYFDLDDPEVYGLLVRGQVAHDHPPFEMSSEQFSAYMAGFIMAEKQRLWW